MILWQRLATIGLAAVANFLTRVLPFWLFKRPSSQTPPFIQGLGDFLPGAIMAMLVIYCLRDVNWTGPSHGLPELAAAFITAGVHLKWHQTFLSLLLGTGSYMLFINWPF